MMRRRAIIHLAEDLDADCLAFTRAVDGSCFARKLDVRRFRNGSEILESFEEEVRPDLLFLDLNLGDYNGLEVLERLHGAKDFALVPTILYTSSQDPKDIRRCYELGANGYLVKPLGIDNLRKLLENCFRYWLESVRIPSSEDFRTWL
tara:strand:+ start:254 stop:697 length:444 start_codon:yes stop_codon:yes gene_type:complete